MRKQRETNPQDIVFSPLQTYDAGTRYLSDRRRNKHLAIGTGLKSLDQPDKDGDFFLPALPGELITVLGRPGNGKTGFMMAWARGRAAFLASQGITDRVVVYITLEQSVEELYAFQAAAAARVAGSTVSITNMAAGEITDEEWEALLSAGARQIVAPLWLIGHSLERRAARPKITMSAIEDGLDYTERWEDGETKGKRIDMVFVDYLQRVPFEGRVESKVVGTSAVLDRCKDGALTFGCPWVVGVQAVREVDDKKIPIPGLNDGAWTSNIEQASDGILAVTRPRKYRDEGQSFGSMIVKGHTQMLVTVLKRKLGPDNFSKWIEFTPEYNKLDDLEVKYYNLRKVEDDAPVF